MPQSRTVRNTEQRICHLEIRTVRSLYFSPDKTACVWQHVREKPDISGVTQSFSVVSVSAMNSFYDRHTQ